MSYSIERICFTNPDYDSKSVFPALYNLNNYLINIGMKALRRGESDLLHSEKCIVLDDVTYGDRAIIKYQKEKAA